MSANRWGDARSRPFGSRKPRHRSGSGAHRAPGRASYTLIRIGAYLAVLPPIVWIYSTREHILLTALLVGLLCAASTWFLLRDVSASQWQRVLYAAVAGLVVAELAWAFSHWGGVPLVGGSAIWLSFYVVSGIVEHGLANSLDRRIVLEYGVVALVGVLVVLASAPWRP
jgi:Protein of unknown function (DUF5656)